MRTFITTRKFSVSSGVAALAITTIVGLVPSATASIPTSADSRADAFYVYEHDDFKGGNSAFHGTDRDLSNNHFNNGKSMNDRISSMRNTTHRKIALYEHAGCSGVPYYAQPDSEDRDLTNNGMDNLASCVKFL